MAALASQGVTPAAFEQERRAALQIEQLQNGVLESAFFTPAEYRRFVVLEGERRRAAFAMLDPQQRPAADRPSARTDQGLLRCASRPVRVPGKRVARLRGSQGVGLAGCR